MRITSVEAIVLQNPDVDPLACDSAQDAVVVLVHTDEGITGIGEVDATPHVVKAFLEAPSAHAFSMGMRDLLVGQDPRDTRRLWHRVYEGTIMAGRRGMGIHALGAIDVALWDIRGKAEGKPIWKLLGGAMRETLVPYASILPTGRLGDEILASTRVTMERVASEGFSAAKIEAVPQVTTDDDRDVIAIVAAARDALGPERRLLVDVGYRWRDAKSALAVLRELEQFDPYLIETPLHVDAVGALATLSRATSIRVATGELHATRFEFLELMDHGGVDVIQPDVPRCGGITEAVRIAELASDRGVLFVPHAWNTGITAAATMHVAAVSANCPFFEYLPPSTLPPGLRKDLLAREPAVAGGRIALPQDPGLGVELDLDAVERFRVQPVAV